MDYMLITLGIACLIVGLVGCVVPIIPGPPIAYAGLIVLDCVEGIDFEWWQHAIWIAIVVIITILDYIVPSLGTKLFKGTKYGSRGCLVGTLIGLFVMPWGIILGPFFGAVIGELIGGRTGGQAFLSGLGSLIGFLVGTLLKLIVCGYFIWVFVAALLS